MAVADGHTLKRAAWAIKDESNQITDRREARRTIRGLKFGYSSFPIYTPFYEDQLNRDKSTYETWIETPNWRDGSEIYTEMNKASGIYEAVLEGFHDAGIDPTMLTHEEIESAIAEIDVDTFEGWGIEDDDQDDSGSLFG